MVNKLPFLNWKHKYRSREDLIKKGFKWDTSVKGYVYTFPVYKDNYKTILVCRLTVHNDMDDDFEPTNERNLMKSVKVDVLDANWNTFYAPFYEHNDAYKEFIQNINNKIKKQLNNMRISSFTA